MLEDESDVSVGGRLLWIAVEPVVQPDMGERGKEVVMPFCQCHLVGRA